MIESVGDVEKNDIVRMFCVNCIDSVVSFFITHDGTTGYANGLVLECNTCKVRTAYGVKNTSVYIGEIRKDEESS